MSDIVKAGGFGGFGGFQVHQKIPNLQVLEPPGWSKLSPMLGLRTYSTTEKTSSQKKFRTLVKHCRLWAWAFLIEWVLARGGVWLKWYCPRVRYASQHVLLNAWFFLWSNFWWFGIMICPLTSVIQSQKSRHVIVCSNLVDAFSGFEVPTLKERSDFGQKRSKESESLHLGSRETLRCLPWACGREIEGQRMIKTDGERDMNYEILCYVILVYSLLFTLQSTCVWRISAQSRANLFGMLTILPRWMLNLTTKLHDLCWLVAERDNSRIWVISFVFWIGSPVKSWIVSCTQRSTIN